MRGDGLIVPDAVQRRARVREGMRRGGDHPVWLRESFLGIPSKHRSAVLFGRFSESEFYDPRGVLWAALDMEAGNLYVAPTMTSAAFRMRHVCDVDVERDWCLGWAAAEAVVGFTDADAEERYDQWLNGWSDRLPPKGASLEDIDELVFDVVEDVPAGVGVALAFTVGGARLADVIESRLAVAMIAVHDAFAWKPW